MCSVLARNRLYSVMLRGGSYSTAHIERAEPWNPLLSVLSDDSNLLPSLLFPPLQLSYHIMSVVGDRVVAEVKGALFDVDGTLVR